MWIYVDILWIYLKGEMKSSDIISVSLLFSRLLVAGLFTLMYARDHTNHTEMLSGLFLIIF